VKFVFAAVNASVSDPLSAPSVLRVKERTEFMAELELWPKYPLKAHSVYLLDDHEVLRRGLRHLLEPKGFTIVGESGSALKAAREIPALRPDVVILDNDLPDGSGTGVCRAVAAIDVSIRCVLMTWESSEAVLIESILAGAWGCLSKQDDSREQLRLISRVLGGYTAYSGGFQPPRVASFPVRGLERREDSLLALSRQEMRAATDLGRGLSNRQISQEMSLGEKTVENLVSSVLWKLGMARRTQAAVLVTTAMGKSQDGMNGFSFSPFPALVAEVGAALLDCTSEAGASPPTDGMRAGKAARLADALAAARTGLKFFRPWPGRTQATGLT
jgi:two-component system response regulator DevR